MPFAIEYDAEAVDDLGAMRQVDRAKVIKAIDVHLPHQPMVETRNRKLIRGQKNPWNEKEEFWELRVESWRVFYDVFVDDEMVTVYAIRKKPPHATTEELL